MTKAKSKADIERDSIAKRQSEIRKNILGQILVAEAEGFSGEFLEIKPDKPVRENFTVEVHMPSLHKVDLS
jgi:hypothetical protein